MAERGIEDAALAVPPLPDDRHDDAFDPRRVLAGKKCRGQHLVRRIDMHVVLLGAIGEIVDPLHDRVVAPGDVDAVVDDVAGVGDPLAAAHELVVDRVAEGVAHAAVIAAEPDAASHRLGRGCELLLLDLRHGVDRHDQAQVGDRRVGEGFGRVLDVDLEAFLLEHAADDVGALLGLVPAPAAPDDQCLAHCSSLQLPCSTIAQLNRIRPASGPSAASPAAPAGSR